MRCVFHSNLPMNLLAFREVSKIRGLEFICDLEFELPYDLLVTLESSEGRHLASDWNQSDPLLSLTPTTPSKPRGSVPIGAPAGHGMSHHFGGKVGAVELSRRAVLDDLLPPHICPSPSVLKVKGHSIPLRTPGAIFCSSFVAPCATNSFEGSTFSLDREGIQEDQERRTHDR